MQRMRRRDGCMFAELQKSGAISRMRRGSGRCAYRIVAGNRRRISAD